MTTAICSRDNGPLAAIKAEPDRPILLAAGIVLTRDATIGDWADANVLLGGALVVGVGPGLDTAANDDGLIVVDCHGCIVMPSGPSGVARIAPVPHPQNPERLRRG